MAKVTFDMREIEKFAKEIENLAKDEADSFFRESALMLASEFMQRVQKRTPIGEYPGMIEFTTSKGEKVSFKNPVAGKQGGHLRNSWKLGKLRIMKAFLMSEFSRKMMRVTVPRLRRSD